MLPTTLWQVIRPGKGNGPEVILLVENGELKDVARHSDGCVMFGGSFISEERFCLNRSQSPNQSFYICSYIKVACGKLMEIRHYSRWKKDGESASPIGRKVLLGTDEYKKVFDCIEGTFFEVTNEQIEAEYNDYLESMVTA